MPLRGIVDAPAPFEEWSDAILIDSKSVLLWTAAGAAMCVHSLQSGESVANIPIQQYDGKSPSCLAQNASYHGSIAWGTIIVSLSCFLEIRSFDEGGPQTTATL